MQRPSRVWALLWLDHVLHVAFNLYFMFYFSKYYHHISIFKIKFIIFVFFFSFFLLCNSTSIFSTFWIAWHVMSEQVTRELSHLTTDLVPTYLSTSPSSFLSQAYRPSDHTNMRCHVVIFNIHLFLKSRTQHNLATIFTLMKSHMDENKKLYLKLYNFIHKIVIHPHLMILRDFGQFHPQNFSEIVITQKHIWFGIPLFPVFIMFLSFQVQQKLIELLLIYQKQKRKMKSHIILHSLF